MSIQSQINRINTNIANAYDAVVTMGGTVPQTQNTANLPDAIATLAQTDYIQLEWIEGTGTQYIDTLITPTSTYKIQVVASNHSNDDTPFFGAYTSWAVNSLLCYGVTINGNQRVYSEGQYSGNNFINHNITSSTPYTITLDYTSMTVNNSSVTFSNMGRINTTLKIFWGGERISKFRLYSAKVWNGNTLVVDYIPALKKSTCEVGLYDKVTNTFYGNSGLGYFRPGIKIAGYSILDYLQSSGAAWFDTGVSGGSKMEYSMAINTLGSKARNYEQYFAGDYAPASHKLYLNGSSATSGVGADQGSNGNWSGTSSSVLNLYNNADAWHNISFYSDGKLYLDTTLKGTGANNGWGTLSYYLFNSHSEPTLISSMRLRYLVMKTDGVIQRFYIPMRKESPITFGVYDLVNDTFVPSASNTAFTANARMMVDDGTNSPYYSIPVVVPTPSIKTGSIADQIDRINENIANAYDVCRQLGRAMPLFMNSVNLEPTILAVNPTAYSYTGSGLTKTTYTSGDNTYDLYKITDSGTLTFNVTLTGDIWICGGGANGESATTYSGWYRPGAGGGGGFANQINNANFKSLTIRMGGANDATGTVITGDVSLSAAGAINKDGGSGGGGALFHIYNSDSSTYYRVTAGTGDGISNKYPFNDSTHFNQCCAGGGGGGYENYADITYYGRGGKGGSNGSSGYGGDMIGIGTGGYGGDTVTTEAGAGGAGKGGTPDYSNNGCKGTNARMYSGNSKFTSAGHGGGGGALMEGTSGDYFGTGGTGIGGICYIRVKTN